MALPKLSKIESRDRPHAEFFFLALLLVSCPRESLCKCCEGSASAQSFQIPVIPQRCVTPDSLPSPLTESSWTEAAECPTGLACLSFTCTSSNNPLLPTQSSYVYQGCKNAAQIKAMMGDTEITSQKSSATLVCTMSAAASARASAPLIAIAVVAILALLQR